MARIDFRLRDGVPYFLEANPLPGLTPGASDLVLLAEGMEIGYQDLIGRIVAAALARLSMAETANQCVFTTCPDLAVAQSLQVCVLYNAPVLAAEHPDRRF